MSKLSAVRDAYRYVVAYQRRVLDGISAVDEVLAAHGFERNTRGDRYKWVPLYTAFPSRDWAPDKWAWDHVPSFACRYVWNYGEANTAGSRHVLVDHIADTAFETLLLSPRRTRDEPDPLADLAPSESSKSVLRGFILDLSGPLPDSVWNRYWRDLMTVQLGIPYTDVVALRPGAEPKRFEAAPLTVTTWWTDLEAVDGPESFEAQFVAPLRRLLAGAVAEGHP